MSEASVKHRRTAVWIVAALFAPIAAIALVLVAIYAEELMFRTRTIESFCNKTPLGPLLSQVAQTIVELFPFIRIPD
jgi:hypothetical protein